MSWLLGQPVRNFLSGEPVFESPVPGEVRLLLFLGAAVLVWHLSRQVRDRVSRRVYRALLGLRWSGLVILAFILGQPALRTYEGDEAAVFTAVLTDTSRSMSIADAGPAGEMPRIEAACRTVWGTPESPGLATALEGKTGVLLYGFDRETRRLGPEERPEASGIQTNLFRSIRDVEAELRALPLASVVLVTDGARNDGGSAEDAAGLLRGRGIPLHVVGIGNAVPPRDLEVVRVEAPRRVRRNTAVELGVSCRHTGFDEPFEVRVYREDILLASATATPAEGADVVRIALPITPDHDGSGVYRVEIPEAEGEAVVENNRREVTIDIDDDRLPVLYLEGSPRLEYRFLRRAMFRDPNFRVVGLLRLGNGRFYVQGADAGEADLVEGFPRTREQLFRYQALILGDIEASYFTPAQLELLEEFVRERGGGLLMLGGVNSFGRGGYADTPVGRLLPVATSPLDPVYTDEHYAAEVPDTAGGHPVMQLVPDPEENRRLWRALPDLIGISPVQGVKPGAPLLIADRLEKRPVLAVHNYGAGRVGAFASGGSWYWQVSMPADDEFHEKFWKQLIRWLVLGARDHLTVDTDAEVYARTMPVGITASVLHRDLRPNNDASVAAFITDPLGNTEQLPMDWILSREGVYQCRYVPQEEGEYAVRVEVADMDLDPVSTGFSVTEPLIEFSNAGLKRDALKRMCETTGGLYTEYPDTAELAERVLRDARSYRRNTGLGTRTPMWDMPLLYFLLLGLAAAEWVLRRRSGLA